MQPTRIAWVLAGTFGAVAALFGLLGLLVSPPVLVAAAPFAAAALLCWYHASGRLAERVRRGASATRDPGTDANAGSRRGQARSRWASATGTGDSRAGPAGGRTWNRGAGGQWDRAGDQRTPDAATRAAERRRAYRVLGLDPDASQEAVARAFRERAKQVHPDQGGSEREFARVRAAYERLSE